MHSFTLYMYYETTKFCQTAQSCWGKSALSPPVGISASAQGRRKELGQSYVISNWHWLQKSHVIKIMPPFPEEALGQQSCTFP